MNLQKKDDSEVEGKTMKIVWGALEEMPGGGPFK